MREPLVAWAGDCMVQGRVELGGGRLSDQVNELDVVTFYDATLCAIDDGHEVVLPEVEVERRELHVIEVDGHRGDPVRRKRTVEERVLLEVGPFVIEGNLHRPPNTLPLASLTRWSTFVPVTEARIGFREGAGEPLIREVVLVNRERIDKTQALSAISIFADDAAAAPVPIFADDAAAAPVPIFADDAAAAPVPVPVSVDEPPPVVPAG